MDLENIPKIVTVDGVLKQNNDVRYEMLLRNYWKDSEYTQYGDGINEYAKIKTHTISPIASGISLVEYTWGKYDKIGDEIVKKYSVPGNDEPKLYRVYPYDQDVHKWFGEYQLNFKPENKLKKVATDKFNELSKLNDNMNQDRSLDVKYITGDMVKVYGMNAETLNHDSDYFSIYETIGDKYDRESGRIADIPEASKANITSFYHGIKNPYSKYYVDRALDIAIKYAYLKGYTNTMYSARDYQYVDEFSLESIRNGVDTSLGSVGDFGNRYKHNILSTNKIGSSDLIGYEYINEEIYNEGDTLSDDKEMELDNSRTQFGGYSNIRENQFTNPNSLLLKTKKLFETHQISTMIGRFHTSSSDFLNQDFSEPSMIDTAKSVYGNSHGRNLLKKNTEKTNGYDNPYCRTWTYHHQYDTLSKTIRPWRDSKGNASIEDIQNMNKGFRAIIAESGSLNSSISDGGKYLAENTVLGNNGLVNIAPKSNGNLNVPIKKCMFSIENLAWKDVPKNVKYKYISKEQVGPNGGRIMWFPPYDIDFQENVTVDWDSNVFIGRGEKVYTYKNTDRTGTLSFTILIDHPGVVNYVNNSSDITDDDILRFFAGCEKLNINTSPYEISDEVSSENPLDIIQEEPEKETGKIKFYVYFPNNYSGNMKYVDESGYRDIGCSDYDWAYYLYNGHGTITTDDEDFLYGYEMTSKDGGISYEGQTDTIPAARKIGVNADWKNPNDDRYFDNPKDCKKKYFYRVDFDLCQKLEDKKIDGNANKKTGRDDKDTNYKDSTCFGLNYGGGEKIKDETHYFYEFFCAVNDIEPKNESDKKRVDELKKLLNEIEITSIDINGSATSQDSKHSKMLAERRRNALKKFIEGRDIIDCDSKDIHLGIVEESGKLNDPTSVNTKEAKMRRYAVVEITYSKAKIVNNDEVNTVTSGVTSGISENVQIDEKNDIANKDKNEGDKTKDEKITQMVYRQINEYGSRYETEGQYFSSLEKNDPMIFKSIKQKFAYFNPAFHSISPEGFNARLNFLHQCTRQGHTVEASSLNYAMSAGNLAFGRMPVCVLRLGDFINTRIIINNMSISYSNNGIQWDLNPEGIGVQPMYAKVSMGIVILGGQSLSGPISRLQNAVTFNYYANTGVYDNRADRITIEEDRSILERKADGGTIETSNDFRTYKERYDYLFNPHPNWTPTNQ